MRYAGVLPDVDDAYCYEGVDFFQARSQWHDVASGYTPILGDWVYYRKNDAPQTERFSHVGIVNDYFQGRILTIEGNVGDPRAVRIVQDAYQPPNFTVVGFANPAY